MSPGLTEKKNRRLIFVDLIRILFYVLKYYLVYFSTSIFYKFNLKYGAAILSNRVPILT